MKQIRRILTPFAFLLILLSLFYVSQAYASSQAAQQAANITTISAPMGCETPLSLDIYYILDLSSSMNDSYTGATNRLEAAKEAISQTNSLINDWQNDSRFGLLTFYGGQNGVGNPPIYEVVTTNQLAFRPFWGGLTNNLTTFNNKLNTLTANGSTPTYHALNFSEGEMVTDNEGNRPIFILLSDGVPTLSSERYSFNDADVQAVPLRDNDNNWRDIEEVRVDGGIAPETGGLFNGEPLADVMQEINEIYVANPEFSYHAIALQGEQGNTFNSDLLEYVAFVGDGLFAAPDNLSDLEASLQQAMESSACDSGITPTPTVTGTPPTSTPTATNTPTTLPTVVTSTPTNTAIPTSCENPQAIDLYYILDLSSSMGQLYSGGSNRLEAAKEAISQSNSLISSWGNGSRFGLITFYGGQNGSGNPATYDVITTNQLAFRPFWGGLTNNLTTFNNKLNTLTPNGSSPTYHAVNFSEGEMLSDTMANHIPVFILLSDGVPTISSERYSFNDADVQAVPLRDAEDNWRDIEEVRVDGGIAPETGGLFNGEPLADVMQEINEIYAANPELSYHAIAIQGEGGNTFNSELLEYVAFVGNGLFAAPDNLTDLQTSLQAVIEESACQNEITPTNTPTITTTPTNTPTPLLTSISPNSAVANAGNVPVIISGYFQEPVTAQVGSVELLTVTLPSATSLHAIVPVESLSEGVYDLAVETDGHLLSLTDAFTVTAPVQQTQFRAMVYLACDNNLADECDGLFNKLELAMLSNPDLHLVAFWDGSDENDSAYYLVQPDDDPETWAQYTDGVNRMPLGEVDSANLDSLVSFAAWASSQYPESYSLLSLVGHGDGWAPDIYPGQILGIGYEWGVGGMLWDEGDGNVMSTAELAQALQWISSANQIDVIYLDACLMSTVEVAAELAPYAEYIVAHENIAWATYPYDEYLSNIDGSTTPSQLAEHIAQVNYESWPAEGHPAQVSIINSNQIENVLTKLDTLALELSTTLPEARLTILEIVSDSTHLDENYDWQINIEDSALDLYDFAEQLNKHPEMPASVKSAAEDMIEALDNNTMLANHRQSGTPWPGEQYWDLSTLHGLSLYFPLIDEWKRAYYGPEALPRFANSTAWDDFIQSWYTQQAAPEPPTELCDDCLRAPWQTNPSLEGPDSYLLHLPLVQR